MKYSGIIFDFNGTLFWDSEKHAKAWIEFSKRLRGKAFSEEELRKYMFGRTNADIITYALGEKTNDEIIKKYTYEKEALYRQMCFDDADNIKLADGVENLLNFLKQKNIPFTIATMSEKVNVDFFIKIFNLAQWFDISKIVFDDGTIQGKPAPDIYLKAANNLGLAPQECIVFEDALSGINAAKSAKIGKIIAVASMENPAFYQKLDCVSLTIKNFNEFDRNILKKN